MRPFVMLHLMLLAAVCCTHRAVGQSVGATAPQYGLGSYRNNVLWYQQQANRSVADRMAHLRRMVRSKYGQRGLLRLFHNFQGLGSIDPRIPGVVKNILLTTSDNENVAKGARRTQLYANNIHNDHRFRLLAVDESELTPLGKTDKDIRFLDRSSRRTIRIEVKDVKPNSQRADLGRLKRQIEKIAWRSRQSGELGVLINRQEFIPAVRSYAEQRGLLVYDNVVTGEASGRHAGNVRIKRVLDDLAMRAKTSGMIRVVSGGAGVGFGAILIVQAAPAAYADLRVLMGEESRTIRTMLALGKHGSFVLGGGGMVAGGAGELGQLLTTSDVWLGRLRTLSRRAGVVAVGAFLIGEGFMLWEYSAGGVSQREFVMMQSDMLGGVAGGLGGAWSGLQLGAIAGSVFGPLGTAIGGSVGAVLGGFGGAHWGSKIVRYVAKKRYAIKDAKLDRRFANFIYDRFGVDPMMARLGLPLSDR